LFSSNYLLKDKAWETIIIIYNLRPRRPPFLRVESDGMGVTSSIRPIFILERAKARRADCAPGPGVFVLLPPVALSLMCSAVMPSDLHFSATSYKKNKYILRLKFLISCFVYLNLPICNIPCLKMFSFLFILKSA